MRIRTIVTAGALLLAAHVVLADNPGSRAETRMVYDPTSTHIILYGGSTPVDSATKIPYDLDDTWDWNGLRWIRRDTAHSAGMRSGHVMVYDSNRARIVVFGGHRTDIATKAQTVLSDTWQFKDGDWSEIVTPNAPSARNMMGGAFDPARDRIVMFGGYSLSTDGKNTQTALHDTWEFDGTTWVQRAADGPKISKPLITYDKANHDIIMVGLDENSSSKTATLMYRYDPAAGAWNQITPDGLPVCVNDAHMAFDGETNSVILVGGVCLNSDTIDATYSWDGTAWTKPALQNPQDRAFGGGIAFDEATQTLVQYGGSIAFGGVRLGTLGLNGGSWNTLTDVTAPTPRSQAVFFTYPGSPLLYMYGGRDEQQAYDEYWTYGNPVWQQTTDTTNRPTTCDNGLTTFDTDRQKLVLVCAASNVWEFDGTTWKNFKDFKDFPPIRRFSSLAYDAALKKTVLFGGYDDTDFIDQTWLWDGTTWTRVKKNPPTMRGQAAMWYDPTLKKTVLYGGIGRQDKNSRIERFADMWSFDGTGWTDMKVDATKTPGQRYSSSVIVNPHTGHALLFGGMLYTLASDGTERQTYVNDLWDWDGAKWTQIATTNGPQARENASLTYDPFSDRIVLYGGFAAHYYGDIWQLDPQKLTWQRVAEPVNSSRRRPAIQTPPAPGIGIGANAQR